MVSTSEPGAAIAASRATSTTTQRQDFRMVRPRISPIMFSPTSTTGSTKATPKASSRRSTKAM